MLAETREELQQNIDALGGVLCALVSGGEFAEVEGFGVSQGWQTGRSG